MKRGRRDFLKITGLTGLGLAISDLEAFASALDANHNVNIPKLSKKLEYSHVQSFNMSGYSAPKISTVRVGHIGLGGRGPAHVENMKRLEGVEIKALCDLRPDKAEAAKKILAGTDHNPDLYGGGKNEWKKLCQRNDIDLVYITTPWYMHTEMAVYAMEHGKHVATEVPAAGTLEECWQIVEASEHTRKHCFMLANMAYPLFQMVTLNMARQGFFGDIVHGDCAYIDSKMNNNFNKNLYWDMWWLKVYANQKGNFYPIHGIGPVCQIMNINRGDKLDYLVSVESNDFMMAKKAKELAATDDFFKTYVGKDYRGNMNTSTIRTTGGKTIMLQHDGTSPRKHTYIHGIYGTEGAALMDPEPPRLSKGLSGWLLQKEYDALIDQYTPNIYKRVGEITKNSGHGGGDLIEDWHLIDCLRNGLPLDIDVYDAATWSCIIPLSAWSVFNRSNSIDVPDFTAGAWKTNKPNMDIALTNGGGNTKIF